MVDNSKNDFAKGAQAMFDYLKTRVANNYHGNPSTQKICDLENAVVTSWVEEAFEEVCPEQCADWKNLTNALAALRETQGELCTANNLVVELRRSLSEANREIYQLKGNRRLYAGEDSAGSSKTD